MTNKNKAPSPQDNLEASFSVLVMSLASSAAFNLGMSPDPQTGKTEVNKPMAKFHIDLIVMLKEKSQSHRSSEESRLIESLLSDLQRQYLQLK